MSRIAALECLLFVAGEPVSVEDLARAMMLTQEEILEGLKELSRELEMRESGLLILEIAGGWQMATRPAYVETVGRMLSRGASRLSRAALETLAIIAYRQPITAPEIEAVRGVSAGGVVKTLSERRLIEECGRKEAPGRPMLYRTSQEFLHYFGINSLAQLPSIDLDVPESASAELIADGVEPNPTEYPLSIAADAQTAEVSEPTRITPEAVEPTPEDA